jgi:hypothetical protein
MTRTPIIDSVTSYIFAACVYTLSSIKCVYGLLGREASMGHLAIPILVGYSACIVMGIRFACVTSNRTERIISILTVISFSSLVASHYTAGSMRHAVTIANDVSWLAATLLVFTLCGNIARAK